MPGFLPSELPVRATARHHWLVILRLPGRTAALAWLVGVVLAVLFPNPLAWALGLLLAGILWLRWREWKADVIFLTGKRIVRTEGIPELTEIEAWMRLDRISGVRIEHPFIGRVVRPQFATIVIEAPGSHPGTHHLRMIMRPFEFHSVLRKLVLDGPNSSDPNDTGAPAGEYVTAPLPTVSEHERYEPPFWKRRGD